MIVASDQISVNDNFHAPLSTEYDTELLHRRNEERLLEEEILAASSLGLHDEDLLLEDYVRQLIITVLSLNRFEYIDKPSHVW